MYEKHLHCDEKISCLLQPVTMVMQEAKIESESKKYILCSWFLRWLDIESESKNIMQPVIKVVEVKVESESRKYILASLLLRWLKIESESKKYILASLLLRWLKIESESKKYMWTAMQRYPTHCSSSFSQLHCCSR